MPTCDAADLPLVGGRDDPAGQLQPAVQCGDFLPQDAVDLV